MSKRTSNASKRVAGTSQVSQNSKVSIGTKLLRHPEVNVNSQDKVFGRPLSVTQSKLVYFTMKFAGWKYASQQSLFEGSHGNSENTSG